MYRNMGKLKGWEVKRWVGDEGEEGGHPVSPPLHSQGDSWGQTLSAAIVFYFFWSAYKGSARPSLSNL